MLARILAVVAAVALVAGALAFRASRDGDDGSGDTTASTSTTVVCATELAALCESAGFAATVEPAGVTADRLAALGDGEDPGLGAWVTLDPWPAIVQERRSLASKEPFADAASVGRTRIGIAVFPERRSVLATACGAELTWKCLGQQAPKNWSDLPNGDPGWGPVKVTHPDAEREATGLAAVGALTVGFFGRADLALIDVDDPAFGDWFSALERSVPGHPASAVDDMLVRGPAAFDLAIVLDAVARPAIDAAAAGRPKPLLAYPAPMTSALLQVVAFGPSADEVRDRISSATREHGWEPAGGAPTGLPPAGLLDAMRTRWREVAA